MVAYELACHALRRGISAYERTDDSGGGFGDLLRDMAALHLRACQVHAPEAKTFGKQLFELMMKDDWGLLAFEQYQSVLSDEGLRAFRTCAEKEWKKVPVRAPDKHGILGVSEHYGITAIMEVLARHDQDVDALVSIKSRDLTSPYRFLEIAELLASANRRDEALHWAERGYKAFSEQPDARLVEFLADKYSRRGRHTDALAISWDQFRHQPAVNSYQRLKLCAERADAWNAWRTQSLTWLREDLSKQTKRTPQRMSWRPGGHSLLVEIFLWEGDSDAALAEAKRGGCTENLWFAIAKAREQDHPQDAVSIYQARLDGIIDRRNNNAYDEAAQLIATVHDLMRRLQQYPAFTSWIDAVRARHKPKRNFIERLQRVLAAGVARGGD